MISKFASGRWVLTVVTALVFAVLAINSKLSQEAVASIIGLVFALYFSRSDRGKPNGGAV